MLGSESLLDIGGKLETLRILYAQDQTKVSQLKDEVDRLGKEIGNCDGAILLCVRCMEDQADGKRFIESMVTAMLQATADEGLAFHLEPVMDDLGVTVTGLKPMISHNGEMKSPKQHGGGVRSICTLGIRMCINLFLSKRMKLMPFMIQDEQLLHVDVQKWPKLIEFCKDFCEQTGFQMIWITHAQVEMPRTIEFVKSGRTLSKVYQEGATIH